MQHRELHHGRPAAGNRTVHRWMGMVHPVGLGAGQGVEDEGPRSPVIAHVLSEATPTKMNPDVFGLKLEENMGGR